MGKNKKAFVPPLLKGKHRTIKSDTSMTSASLVEKRGSEPEEVVVVTNPNLEKANISSSLIKNGVSNSDDTIKELVAGKVMESALTEHDGFFLHDSQKAPDVYEFQSSPVGLPVVLTTKNGRNKRSLQQDCPKQEERNRKRNMKKKKDSSVKQSVLKDIERMQKAMELLRKREQALMTSSEQ